MFFLIDKKLKIIHVDYFTIIKIYIYFNTLTFSSTLHENIGGFLTRSKNKFEFHVRYDKCMMSYKNQQNFFNDVIMTSYDHLNIIQFPQC